MPSHPAGIGCLSHFSPSQRSRQMHTPLSEHERWLGRDPSEGPVVLQLGGADPESLGRAVELAAPYGYDEINLNCGCPSDKVAGKGAFGAALMREPALVGEVCAAMREAAERAAARAGTTPPEISVKCRIGVDDEESFDAFYAFVEVPERLGLSGTEFVERAIARGVLIIPGAVFSARDTHFRISYAVAEDDLARGLDIIADLLAG